MAVILDKLQAFTFQYVSINTKTQLQKSLLDYLFTFQYVSINTMPRVTENVLIC